MPTITSSHDVRSKRVDNEYTYVPKAQKITSKILDKRFEDSDAEDEPEFDQYDQNIAAQDQAKADARERERMEDEGADPDDYPGNETTN